MNDEIYYRRVDTDANLFPYRSLVAGARRADPRDPAVTHRFHEHCFILTRAGRGIIELAGRRHLALPGDIAWIDTSRAYAHHCYGETECWHYIWISLHGFGLEALHAKLALLADPIFRAQDIGPMDSTLSVMIDRLKSAMAEADGDVSAEIATFLAQLTRRRSAIGERPHGPTDRLSTLAAKVRATIDQAWSIPQMAALSGVSISQLHRLFRQQFGATPAEWLRAERINLARRYLVSGFERIATIGALCGYSDPFHFSRDFRKLTGMSPSQYRHSSETAALQ